MRKVVLLYVFFQLIYSVTNAQIKLLDYVSPASGATNPTHIDSLGKGGYMVVPTISDRNAIPITRRKFGMLVFVQVVDSIYKLSATNLDNSNWVTLGLYSAEKVKADAASANGSLADTARAIRAKILSDSTRISSRITNVDNTTDLNKPISTATQSALDLKANLASPALTGIPTAPTPADGTSNTQIATTSFVNTSITASSNSIGGVSSSTIAIIAQDIADATPNNNPNTLVKRDGSGNFSATNVTANLSGNASTATKLATPRTIYGNAFDGTANLTQKIEGEFGGTGASNIGKRINLGGNILTASDFTTAGNFSTTLTSTGVTNITLPRTGTISTLAGTESLTNKTIVSPIITSPTISSPSLTGSPTATTPAADANSTEVATAAFVKSQISSAATDATTTAKGIIKLTNDLGGTADLPTVNTVGGVSSSTIGTINTAINAATSNSTLSTLVKRDASGNFSAGTISAALTGNVVGNVTGDVTGNLTGNASTTTQLQTPRTIYGNSFNGTADLIGPILGTYGGTGVNNGSKTITLGGNILTGGDFTTAGNFNTTLTSTGATNITLPTMGTISTLAGTETLTNKTIVSPSLTGSPTAPTPVASANGTEVATAAFVKSQISSAATDATTTAKGIIKLANDLGGTADLPTVNTVGGVSSSTIGTINTTINSSTFSNTVNTLVKRDATGNFSAGNITASLTGNVTGNVVGNVTGNLAGNASTTTQLQTPRTIYGNTFNGTTDLEQAIVGTYGGTGVNNGSKTITLGGNIVTASNFTTAGIYSTTLTSTGETNITLPTTGTIATLAGTETLTNKTIVSPSLIGIPTAPTPAADASSTEVATAAFVLSRISNAATPATTTAKGIIKLANDLGGTADLPTVNTVGGVSSSTIGTINTTINAATATNTVSTLVKRDASGNFSAGTITAALTGNVTGNVTGNLTGNVTGNLAGNASTTTQLETARTIYGNSFNGTANLEQAIAGTYGGTGINNGSKTITLGGNILTASDFTTAGNFSTTLTSTGVTNITLPTTGTISTLAGTETLTNKTIVNATLTGSPTAPNPADAASNTEVATAAFVLAKITASSNSIGGVSSSTIAEIASDIAAATSSNTANTLVKRDASGNFYAGTVTANLAGNASTATKLSASKNIYGNAFDGSVDLSGPIVGTYGGTGVNNGSKTITLGGNILTASDFTTAGNFSTTLTSTGATNITLPTTGTIATLAGTETLTNKTIVSPTIASPSLTGSPTAPTPAASATGTEVATAAFVKSQISSAATDATNTAKGIIKLANDLGGTADLPTVNSVGGVNSSTITTINSTINAATSSSTVSTLVKRDASGNFSAGIISSNLVGNVTGSLTGNVTGNLTGNVTGDLTGNVTGNVVGNVTGNLAGNASTTSQLQTPRTIYGNSFNGTANLEQAIVGTYGGTGVNNGSKTITLGGNILTASDFTTSGNYSTTLVSTGLTNITLPTTGTIATLAGTETLTNKTIVSPSILAPTISSPSLTGTPTAPTPVSDANNTQVATTAFVKSQISSSATDATSTAKGIIKLANDLGGTADLPTVNTVGGVSSSTIGSINTTINAATSNNTANTLVKRDGSGNFSAGNVTASLTGNVVGNVTGNLAGNASTTTQLETARTIYGNSFNGTANLEQAIAGTYGGTGINNGSKTITLGGNILTASDFTTAGNFSTTLTSTGATNITLPTTGTIATLAGTETLTNKTIVSPSILTPTISSPSLTGTPTAPTPASDANGTQVATTAFVRAQISSSATGATSTEKGIILLAGDLGGTADIPKVNTVGGVSSSTITTIASNIASATSTNTPSTLVKRDASGNFSAGNITAALTGNVIGNLTGNVVGNVTGNLAGNASTTTQLETARTIYGNTFNGTADLGQAIAGTYGGTGINNGSKTITLGGNILTANDFTTAGNFSTTLTSTGATNITLPTTGTIATLAGTETLTNKTIVSPTISSPSLTGTPTAPTPAADAIGTQVATAAFVRAQISSSATGATSTEKGIILLAGDLGGTADVPRVNTVGGVSSSTITTIASDIASATSTNTFSTIVKRDASGNFSAGIITASLSGNASTTTQLQTSRTIYGNSFNGTADLGQAISGTYGGTGVSNVGKTITLGGNILTANDFTTAGNFSTTLTSTGATNITLPTTGTLATLAGTETLTNKTIESVNLTGVPTAPTAANSVNNTQIATTAFVNNLLTTSSISGDKIVGVIPVINGGTGQSTYTEGQVLIGTTSGTLSKSTITAGSGVTITNGNGSITVSATGSGGTVTSINPITVNASGNTFTSTVSNANSIPDISITLPLASLTGTSAGLLSKTDYDTFNAKQVALTAGSGISLVGGTISATGLTTSNLSSTAGITNGQLANSKTTLGSTDLVLGGTNTSVTGLSSVNSTNFIGALTGNVTGNLTGDVTGDLTGNVVGNVTGNLAGNASTTTQLQNARTIYGNSFDGTADLTGPILGTYGGTGVNNGTKTISLGGNISTTADFNTAGNFSTTLTSIGTTNITLPTTGTIATLAGTETLTNKTLVSATLTGSPTAPTPADAANSTQVATAAFVLSRIAASSNSIGGVSSSTVASVSDIVNAATSSNTANTLVKRDGSGNFSAGNITASLTGDVTGNLTGNVVGNVTGNLAGNASTTTQLQNARTIYGNSFDGTANLTQAITGQYGGTGVNNSGKTITLGGNILTSSDFTTAGSFSTTLTSTGATNITLPTTGTLATLAGTETLTNKTIVSPTISSPSLTGTPTAITPADAANNTQVATTAFVVSKITSSSNSIGGVSSSTITTIAAEIAAATSSNTANTLVKRDGSGNFSANIITASLAGNASTTTQLQTARSIYGNSFNGGADITQAITGQFGGTGVNNTGKTITLGGNILTASDFTTAGNFSTTLTSTGETNITLPTTGTIATLAGTETLTNKTIESPSLTGTPTAPTAATSTNSTQLATTAYVNNLIASTSINSSQISGTIATDVASATSSNTANTLVKRDGSGNFSANIITASLAGNASTTTQLQTARSIYGNSFNGGADITQAIAGQFGGTGVNNTGKTITLGGNILTAGDFTIAGNFSTTLTSTGATNITLPTTGTIATLAGTETLTNKTIESPIILTPTISSPSLTGTSTAVTPSDAANNTQIATTAFVVSKITSSSNSIGGVSSSTITTIAAEIAAATSSNTANTLVKRDGTGNFSAGTITASLAGNASTTTQLQTARSIYGNDFNGTASLTSAILGTYGGTGVNNGTKTISLGGNISTTSDFITAGNYSTTLTSTGVTNVTLPTTGTIATLAGTETLTNKTIVSPSLTGTPTAPTAATSSNSTQVATTAYVNNLIATTSISSSQISGTIATDVASATSSNTANTIVKRDGSGSFSAGTITATLAGNASTTTQLQTARSIYGNSFNGGADLTSAIAGQFGGTGVDNGTKTISLGGNISTTADFITAGNYTTTLTSTGITNVTLPTTGTIATLAGTETLTNKTIVSPTISSPALTGSATAITADISSNNTLVATTAFVRSRINADTALLIQKSAISGILSDYTATLSSAKTFIDKNDTATMMQRRYISDVLPVATRVTSIENSTTTLGATAISIGGTYTTLTGLSAVSSTSFVGTLSGTASTANKLTASKNINGVAFDGTSDITISAASNTLTGTALASNITASSLTSVGTITSGVWSGTAIAVANGGTGLTSTPTNGQIDIGNGTGFTRTTITPGSGITITNASGGITVSTSGITSANLSSTAGITNAQLANSKTTIGTTDLVLGGTVTSVAGLTSLTSTNLIGTLSGTSSTANKLTATKNINGVAFDGTADITVTAAAGTLTGATLASNVTASSLTSVGTITSGIWSGTTIAIEKGGTGLTVAPTSGQIDIGTGTGTFTRTTLTPGLGISIANGSGSIGITALAGTISGTTLANNVVASSLTSVGTITTGVWSGTTIAVAKGGTGATTLSGVLLGNGTGAISTATEGTNYSLVREINDEFTVTSAQATTSTSTSGLDGVVSAVFTLAQIPNTKSLVKIYVNGVRISSKAFTFYTTNTVGSGANTTTPTINIGYIPFQNGNYRLTTSDRVQIDYYY